MIDNDSDDIILIKKYMENLAAELRELHINEKVCLRQMIGRYELLQYDYNELNHKYNIISRELANKELNIKREKEMENRNSYLNTEIGKLDLSTRAKTALYYEGVFTIYELVSLPECSLIKIPNIGRGTFIEILDYVVTGLGLTFSHNQYHKNFPNKYKLINHTV